MSTLKKTLAVDVGFGNVKAVWSRPTPHAAKALTSWKEICFKAVAHPNSGHDSSGMNGTDRISVEVGGDSFFLAYPVGTLGRYL